MPPYKRRLFFFKMAFYAQAVLKKCHFSEIIMFGNTFSLLQCLHKYDTQKRTLNHRSVLGKSKYWHTFSSMSLLYSFPTVYKWFSNLTKKCHGKNKTKIKRNTISIYMPNTSPFYFILFMEEKCHKSEKNVIFLACQTGPYSCAHEIR